MNNIYDKLICPIYEGAWNNVTVNIVPSVHCVIMHNVWGRGLITRIWSETTPQIKDELNE